MTLGHLKFTDPVLASALTGFELEQVLPWTKALGRIAAPLLGFSSGLLLAFAVQRTRPTQLLWRRARTLLGAFIVWNGAMTLLMAAAGAFGFGSSGNPFALSAVLGIYAMPNNLPLHYLIDLFQCVSVAVCTFHLFRRRLPLMGIVAILGVFCAFDAAARGGETWWPRPDLVLFFSLGFLLGFRCQWLLRCLAEVRGRPFLIGGVSALLFVTTVYLSDGRLPIILLQRLSGAILALAIVARVDVPEGLIDQRLAFRLFCSHWVVFAVVGKILPIEAHPSALWGLAEFGAAISFATGSLEVQDIGLLYIAGRDPFKRVTGAFRRVGKRPA
ncbi:hypothetical protein GGQ59_002027 [Parvularcula dongshanensis]|uniref:Acyltransferase 3 domain-containing protein n=2 Tax=Parvularcula dongshanensis TaxID=1173995 RepID=A0A840I648_9PROT|nr:acyltransferase family protein [Parvularcula dongshanensis]MBB4659490.1 hypothetical protein [Parvularcula dongshanensis]